MNSRLNQVVIPLQARNRSADGVTNWGTLQPTPGPFAGQAIPLSPDSRDEEQISDDDTDEDE